ncbi:putative mitochondrial protein [Trifolium repens]|nr:putative mitochondrial protein [Trifolium repens]
MYPSLMSREVKFSYHFPLVCLRPYKLFCNLHTIFDLLQWTPYGIFIYTSSCRSPWRNALFTSTWCKCHFFIAATASKVLTVVNLATGEKVSK